MHITSCSVHAHRFPHKDIYPFNLPLLSGIEQLDLNSPVTIFIGDNGSGKSTVLRAIAQRCNIHIWSGPERQKPVDNPWENCLHQYLDITWSRGPVPGSFFASEMFRNYAQNVDEWASLTPGLLNYYGGKPLTSQSHGQYHLAYFNNRYKIKGLYFLDEPENALAPEKQLELLRLIHRMSGQGHAQFIIATHSPILMACPGARIYLFSKNTTTRLTYKETPHYRFYKDFINNTDTFISS